MTRTHVCNSDRPIPSTDDIRTALSNVIRDIARAHDLTDLQFAAKIGTSVSTIRRARDKEGTLDNEIMARMGAVFGPEAMTPYTSLWQRETDEPDLMPLLADAMGALSRAKGHQGTLNALPVVKALIDSAQAYVTSGEQMRLRAVS